MDDPSDIFTRAAYQGICTWEQTHFTFKADEKWELAKIMGRMLQQAFDLGRGSCRQ